MSKLSKYLKFMAHLFIKTAENLDFLKQPLMKMRGYIRDIDKLEKQICPGKRVSGVSVSSFSCYHRRTRPIYQKTNLALVVVLLMGEASDIHL
jgi:hypothetical protein